MGIVSPDSAGGLQVNIMVAKNPDNTLITFCDHNCAPVGGYTCPAASIGDDKYTLNDLIFASPNTIVSGINNGAEAIKLARNSYFDDPISNGQTAYDLYVEDFNIPETHANAIKSIVLQGSKKDINIFGGNTEMHPEIIEIIQKLKENPNYVVNFTTTGRRFMLDPEFAENILQTPPHVLALSADNFRDGNQIRTLNDMSLDDIYASWTKIPTNNGSLMKAQEAIYAAKIAEDKIPTLFNVVIHPQNIRYIDDIVTTLSDVFPTALLNPFPAQSSFYAVGENVFDETEARLYETFVDSMIKQHKTPESEKTMNHTRRLHYWLLQKSIFDTFDGEQLLNVLSGGVWKCYDAGSAASYLQIGDHPNISTELEEPGGHPSCFWNPSAVPHHEKVQNMALGDIAYYLGRGIKKIANNKPCGGCTMPRLLGPATSTESGMKPELKSAYLELRKEHAGY